MARFYPCKTISPGNAQGEAVISSEEILFYFTDRQPAGLQNTATAWRDRALPVKSWYFPAEKEVLLFRLTAFTN